MGFNTFWGCMHFTKPALIYGTLLCAVVGWPKGPSSTLSVNGYALTLTFDPSSRCICTLWHKCREEYRRKLLISNHCIVSRGA